MSSLFFPQVATPPKSKYIPPAWDPKVNGSAFGDFNRGPPKPACLKNKYITPGNGRLMPLHNPQVKPPVPQPFHKPAVANAEDVAKLQEVRFPSMILFSKSIKHTYGILQSEYYYSSG